MHCCTPVEKVKSIKIRMGKFGVCELEWPAKNSNLNHAEHLWDELERRLQAKPSCLTRVCDIKKVFLEKNPISRILKLLRAF